MSLLPNDDDWGCLMDLDTMFLTSNVGHQLEEIVKKYPNTGLFTAITNRVGLKEQCYRGNIDNDPNILNWKRVAKQLQENKWMEMRELKHPISGHLMMVKKSVWKAVGGFPEVGKILAIDNSFSKRVLDHNLEIQLMEGVFVFHFYRMDKNITDKTHLRPSAEQGNIYSHNKRVRYLEGT